MLPPIPPWDGIHPLIIHFPIALLLIAPLPIVLGMLIRKCSRAYWICALALMALGAAGTIAAVSSGEAGEELVDMTPAISTVVEKHSDLAEQARTLFTVLTVVFAAIVYVPTLLRKDLSRKAVWAIGIVFLLAYTGAAVSLINAGHYGARLVHEFGVQAMMGK